MEFHHNFVFKRCIEGRKKKGYLSDLRYRLLSDVKLLDTVETLLLLLKK